MGALSHDSAPRDDRAVRRGARRARWLTVSMLTAIASAALVALPAHPAAAAAAFDVPASTFVSATSVTITGTKDVGSTLVIRRGGAVVCTVGDPDALTFTCSSIAVSNGVVEFTGTETLADESTVPMAPLTLRVLAAPSIDGAGSSVITTGRFSGFAEPGADIELSTTGPGGSVTHSCPTALSTGFWSCVVDVASGSYQVRARQTLATLGPEWSVFSSAVSASIDRTPPAPPTISSPRGGTTTQPGATVRGSGEPDALLQVFVNGSLACETIVTASGAWACPVRWPSTGTLRVQALQRDAAGNFSAASPRVDVRYERPAAPPPADEGSSEPQESPTPIESPTLPPAPPAEPTPPVPFDPITENWGTPTGFGGSLPTVRDVIERGGWLLAPLAGLAYLMLVAIPVRTFATVVKPRMFAPPVRLTGRNRRDEPVDEPVNRTLSPVLIAAATLGGAAVIAALSGGIDAEVRYVRLTAAIGLGLVVLNVVGVLMAGRIAGRFARVPAGMRLLPGILFVALVLALFSRFGELQPPLLVGVLIAAAAAAGSGTRAKAGVAVAQTSAVAALALLAWAVHDLITPSEGFWMTLWSETAAAVTLGGLGSLLILLLPIGPLPGRTLFAASRPAWATVTFVSASLVGAIVASGPAFPLASLILLAAAFAAVLFAVTIWVRWVAPAVRTVES